MSYFLCNIGGWREREKAREESWGPPRDSGGADEDDEHDRDDRNDGERFRERRPPRCSSLTLFFWFLVSLQTAVVTNMQRCVLFGFKHPVCVFLGRKEAGGEAHLTSPAAAGETVGVTTLTVMIVENAVNSEIAGMTVVIIGPLKKTMMMVRPLFVFYFTL